MTRILVETKVGLNGVGGTGAVLFVLAPLIGGFMVFARLQAAERSLRYGMGTSATTGDIVAISLIASALAMTGLIMVLVGRHYQHEVQILKADAAPQKAQTPPFGGTEAERHELGLK